MGRIETERFGASNSQKMKVDWALFALVSARVGKKNKDIVDKRYADLYGMTKKVWKEMGDGSKFDADMYWNYGCHCNLMNIDQPIQLMGRGVPTDELDKTCRKYKQCLKCVREKQGIDCTTENYKYSWKWNKRTKRIEILSSKGTCSRELGECDRIFAYSLQQNSAEYKDSNNRLLFGDFDPTNEANCPRNNGGGIHGCCGGYNAPFESYNLEKQQCCPVGKTGLVKMKTQKC